MKGAITLYFRESPEATCWTVKDRDKYVMVNGKTFRNLVKDCVKNPFPYILIDHDKHMVDTNIWNEVLPCTKWEKFPTILAQCQFILVLFHSEDDAVMFKIMFSKYFKGE
jgi:hypothetical protein